MKATKQRTFSYIAQRVRLYIKRGYSAPSRQVFLSGRGRYHYASSLSPSPKARHVEPHGGSAPRGQYPAHPHRPHPCPDTYRWRKRGLLQCRRRDRKRRAGGRGIERDWERRRRNRRGKRSCKQYPSDYQTPGQAERPDYSQVPAYSGSPYAVINDNAPNLNASDAEGFAGAGKLPRGGREVFATDNPVAAAPPWQW